MRILRSIYHFLLFLIVIWTVYNTFIFICLLALPTTDNEFAKLSVFDFWDLYLFGALDFTKFSYMLSDLLSWLSPESIRQFWPFLLYIFLVNGLATYICCNNQNPVSACILALAPCIAGIYPTLLFRDGMLLIYGIIGIIIFYTALYTLNAYRKKHRPQWRLPDWLEWRKPNMVPPKKAITDIISGDFDNYRIRS